MTAEFIIAFPFITGILLILAGASMAVFRIKGHIHTEGIVTDSAKSTKRKAKVTMNLEAPVVRYKIGGEEYCCAAAKFFTDGVMDFSKGRKIKIRVRKSDHRRFVPEESGGVMEKLLIFGGIFMMIANIVILLRYGG